MRRGGWGLWGGNVDVRKSFIYRKIRAERAKFFVVIDEGDVGGVTLIAAGAINAK